MPRYLRIGLCVILSCAACAATPTKFDWDKYQTPDWHKYQAQNVPSAGNATAPALEKQNGSDRFTFNDLKNESDQSLARRLFGAVGLRIAYIDRHKDRWRYYHDDSGPAESLDLYTHPDALGSQYGLCGVEKYSLRFDDSGRVSSVSMTPQFGIEGAIFQKSGFDWDYYYKVMCSSVSSSHAPSYFPAPDSGAAQDLAMLLVPVIDLAASTAPLPYRLSCRNADDRPCTDHVRKYLGDLRLEDIDAFSLANCPLRGGPQAVCFTIQTDDGRLGPFPKSITVKGSTYMHKIRVDSVDVNEGFTIS